jgi:hypothetical protein
MKYVQNDRARPRRVMYNCMLVSELRVQSSDGL